MSGRAGTSGAKAGAAVNGAMAPGTSGSNTGGGLSASGPREFGEFKKAGLKCDPGSGTGTRGTAPIGPGVTGSKFKPGTAGTVPGNVVVSGNKVTGAPTASGPREFCEFKKAGLKAEPISGANDNDGVG